MSSRHSRASEILMTGLLSVVLLGAVFLLATIFTTSAFAQTSDKPDFEETKRLAESGDVDAQNALGRRYDEGRGVTENDTEAVKWFRKAAEQGNAAAQAGLGLAYELGEGVPQNDAEAVKWYQKSAEQGNAKAQLFLGGMYAEGGGIPRDLTLAYKWLNLARLGGGDVAETSQVGLDLVTPQMTQEQIAEAQKLASEWWEQHQRKDP